MSLRVVHIINSLLVGGAEMMLYKLLAGMDRRRFEPVVVSLRGEGPLTRRILDLDVPVHDIGLRLDATAAAAGLRLAQVLRHVPADLIQGWQYYGNLAARLAQALRGRPVPVLWNIRHSIADLRDEPRLTAALVKLGARLSGTPDRIVYAAHASALQHEALGYRADRRIVLPNGFDTERFRPSDDARLGLRRELGLAPTVILVGQVARYHPIKNHAGFLRAAELLLRSHPDVHFVLAGAQVDAANPELRAATTRPPLAGRTHLLGRRDDMPRLIAALDILTSASHGEGFPNVIGEAMACGVPCVATDVGDSALIIGGLGRVVPPRHPEALSRAWASLIETEPSQRLALGRLARRRIIEQYALPAVVARYEALYEELGTRHPAPLAGVPVMASRPAPERRPGA